MTDNISQTGSGNIGISNVKDSEINILIGKSYEYNEMLIRLKEFEENLADIAPDRVERLNELNEKIDKQKRQIEQFKHGVTQLAETFSRIEIDTDRLARARAFFEKGEFGEARAVLETELEQINDEHIRLLAQKERFETDTLPKLIHNAIEFFVLAQATAIDFANPSRFEDACRYFEQSIAVYAFFGNLFNYAVLLEENKQFHLAEPYYERILTEFGDQLSQADCATALNNLANLHRVRNEYEAAEKEYGAALVIYRELAVKNRQEYLQDVAMTLNNLAVLHSYWNEHETAEKEYSEALEIRRKLAKENPQMYLQDIAMTLNNLAVLHADQGNYKTAEKEHIEALRIRKDLALKNPQIYLPDLAMTLNNLANLHNIQKEYEAAEKEHKEALKIRRKLAAVSPQVYLPNLAMTLNNLAALHRDQKKYEAAEKEYEESLRIRRQLAAANPQAYLPDMAMTFNNLAILHSDRDEYEVAEKEFLEALRVYRQLAAVNPQAYLPDVVLTLNNLAMFYRDAKPDKERSIELALEAVRIVMPFVEQVGYTQKYLVSILGVLRGWGMTEEEIMENLLQQ